MPNVTEYEETTIPNVTEYEDGDCYAKIREERIYNTTTLECLQYYSPHEYKNKINELFASFNEEKNIATNETAINNFFYFLHASLTYLDLEESHLQNLSQLLARIFTVKQPATLENKLIANFFELTKKKFPLLFDEFIKQLPATSLINLQQALFTLADSCLDTQHCQPKTLEKIANVLSLIETKIAKKSAMAANICPQLQAKQTQINDYLALANATQANTTLTRFTTDTTTNFSALSTTPSQYSSLSLPTNSTNDTLINLASEPKFDLPVSNTTNRADVNASPTLNLLTTHTTFFSPAQEIIAARLGLEAGLGLVQGITLSANDKLFKRFFGKNPSLNKKIFARMSSTTLSAAINLARYPIAGPIVNPLPLENTLENLAIYFGSNLLTSTTILTMTIGIQTFVDKFLGQGRTAQLINFLTHHLPTLNIVAMLVMSDDFQKNPGLASSGVILHIFFYITSYVLINRLFSNPTETDELTYSYKNFKEKEPLLIEGYPKQTGSLPSTSNSSSASTNTSQISNDSAVSNYCSSDDTSKSAPSELAIFTQDNYYSFLQQITPNLKTLKTNLQELIKFINGRALAFNNKELPNHKGRNVKTSLEFSLSFIKALENFSETMVNTEVYHLNRPMPQKAITHLNYTRTILSDIKKLTETLESQSSTENNAIKQKLTVILKAIPNKYDLSSSTSSNHSDSSSKKQDQCVFLAPANLDNLKTQFGQLNTLLANKAKFARDLNTIRDTFNDKIFDFCCMTYPNAQSMVRDQNIIAVKSFFPLIIRSLEQIESELSSLKNPDKQKEVKTTIKFMINLINQTTNQFESKNAYVVGEQNGLKRALTKIPASNNVNSCQQSTRRHHSVPAPSQTMTEEGTKPSPLLRN